MAFTSPVVAGTTLIAPAIRSANYVPGVSGWTINRDGTSEFAGGTFRGPVVVIDPLTGNVLASIGANGNGSFQNVYATGDVVIGTTSVLAAITAAGRGIVSRASIAATLPVVPAASVLVDACWIGFTIPDATRQYVLRGDPAWVNNTNSINGELFTFNWVLNQNGTNTTIYSEGVQIDPGATLIPTTQILLPTLAAAPATLKLQYCNNSSSTTYIVYNENPFNLWIEDIGQRLSAGSGGTGSPSGSQNFSKQYFATSSQVYNGNTGNSESDPNNLYTGQLSGRSNGSESSMWVFPGATIRSDLVGATITSASVFMYATNSAGAHASSRVSWLTNTSCPASSPGVGANATQENGSWPGVPGWGSFDATAMVSTNIVTGLCNSMYMDDTAFTNYASSYYGAGNATFKPYIQINYNK